MRKSEAEKQQSHQRIVEAAAQMIRTEGTEDPTVAEMMSAAGLTHGGFYKHFESRDQLLVEATEQACAEGGRWFDRLVSGTDDPLGALIREYLSEDHRDRPGTGCAVAALARDAGREGSPIAAVYTAQVRRYIDFLQRVVGSAGSATEDRERATAAMSAMVGGLLLARAVDDPDLSSEILSSVAHQGALIER